MSAARRDAVRRVRAWARASAWRRLCGRGPRVEYDDGERSGLEAVLVTASDSDFAALKARLKHDPPRAGVPVVLLQRHSCDMEPGQKRVRLAAKLECCERALAAAKAELAACDAPEAPPKLDEFLNTPVALGHLGNLLRLRDPAFTHRRYGFKTLRALVAAQPGLLIYKNERGAEYVKLC